MGGVLGHSSMVPLRVVWSFWYVIIAGESSYTVN